MIGFSKMRQSYAKSAQCFKSETKTSDIKITLKFVKQVSLLKVFFSKFILDPACISLFHCHADDSLIYQLLKRKSMTPPRASVDCVEQGCQIYGLGARIGLAKTPIQPTTLENVKDCIDFYLRFHSFKAFSIDKDPTLPLPFILHQSK